MLGARLAWVVDWVAVHVELGRAELVRPNAHSLLAGTAASKSVLAGPLTLAFILPKIFFDAPLPYRSSV